MARNKTAAKGTMAKGKATDKAAGTPWAGNRIIPRSKRPFPFFSLPRELQDQIYGEVWCSYPSFYRWAHDRQRSPLIDITADYKNTNPKCRPNNPRLPVCMLPSKQFVREALEQYFRKIDWTAKIPASLFTTRIFLFTAGHHSRAIFDLNTELGYIDNGNRLFYWIQNKEYSSTVIQTYQMWPITLPILRKFKKGLVEPNGLRSLHIAVGVSLPRAKGIVKVDLSDLERIGFSLDKLTVNVHYIRIESDERLNNLQQLMEAEVKRLGEVMIGRRVTLKFSSSLKAWKFEVTKASD